MKDQNTPTNTLEEILEELLFGGHDDEHKAVLEAKQQIESLISEAVNKARLSELDWALSRLNTFGRETDSGALNRAINEIDDNIALVVEELTKTNTHMEGNENE